MGGGRADALFDALPAAAPDGRGKDPSRPLSLSDFKTVLSTFTSTFRYAGPSFLADVEVARQVKDQRRPLVILLGGTSGCGKSTLGSLLASRLGITTVVSTDHVRDLLRSVVAPADDPVLWASSYHAGEALRSAGPAAPSPEEQVQRRKGEGRSARERRCMGSRS